MRFQYASVVFAVVVGGAVLADDLAESKAIEKIELLGGNVKREETLPGRPVVGVDLHGSMRFNDKYVHLLKSFSNLKSINLTATAIGDEGAEQIGQLSDLTEIRIAGSQITASGLKKLRQTLPNAKICEDNHEEAMAANEIVLLRGKISRNEKLPGRPVWLIDLSGKGEFNDARMHLLKEFNGLTNLYLTATGVTDHRLNEIANLTALDTLVLNQTNITGTGFQRMRDLKALRLVYLRNTQLTDDGLKELAELDSLTALFLNETRITDDGLMEISKLRNLINLALSGTQITDNGLKHLTRMTSLRFLDLSQTQTTDAGVNELKQELPNLYIRR